MNIPDEAVEAAMKAYLREFAHDDNAEYIARLTLEAAKPYMLSHFANRIDWRCSECEDQIDPVTALRKLQEEAGT